jgi:biopolymer transport protein ExbB/TolQ
MHIILKRLTDSFALSIAISDSHQDIAQKITNLSAIKRAALVNHHTKINVEYAILCSKIASQYTTQSHSNACRAELEAALKINQLLMVLNQTYLSVPREVQRLQKEEQRLQQWLSPDLQENQQIPTNSYASQSIREWTATVNLPRLFSVRLRRLLVAIARVQQESSSYRQYMLEMDTQYFGPFFSHLAWLYFIPRVANNLAMIVKHTISNPFMHPEESALSWQTRLKTQLQARWPDLSNDVPWLIANFLTCFVLVGELLPWAILLGVCMQFYEIAQAATVCYMELHHLDELHEDYLKLLTKTSMESPEHQPYLDFISHLTKRYAHEKRRLRIPVVNTSILLIAIILAVPIFPAAYAVIGGIIAVLATIWAYTARKQLEKHPEKPVNDLFQRLTSELAAPSRMGMFSQSDITSASKRALESPSTSNNFS